MLSSQVSDSTNTPAEAAIFPISPLIRITLVGLYVALTSPLPFLAQLTDAPISPSVLWVGLGVGLAMLLATLSERAIADDRGIHVTYAAWVPKLFRKGWSLSWSEVKALKPRSTGQGGLVYYFVSESGQGYLLPVRVVGFAKLVDRVQAKTGIDTRDVRPLAQPWMYFILLACTVLLLAIDAAVIASAIAG